jgi:hypothetical protein
VMGKIAVAAYLIVGFFLACAVASLHREECRFPIRAPVFLGVTLLWGPIMPVAIAEAAIYGDDQSFCDE